VEECLANAARHSCARQVTVRAWHAPPTGRLHLEVADDGVGSPSRLQMGYGLLGATERVRSIGGTLGISSNQPSGLIFSFILPAIVREPKVTVSG
jgi:two-component system, NarL family, sensor histidine kinase UhpB